MKHKVTGKQNNSARCIVCGDQNEFSLGTRFYNLDNGDLVGVFRTEDWHQSYPGRVHGGMIAAILDETIGRAVCIEEPNCWGVTVELTLKYKKPVPTEATLKCVGRVTRNTRRVFEGEGELLLPDGEVAATAHGKYMKLPVDEISEDAFVDSEWYYLEEEDPEEIEC